MSVSETVNLSTHRWIKEFENSLKPFDKLPSYIYFVTVTPCNSNKNILKTHID